MLHRVIWLKHGLFLLVDDGLEFLPAEVGPLLAVYSLMFFCIPLSWSNWPEAGLDWMGVVKVEAFASEGQQSSAQTGGES